MVGVDIFQHHQTEGGVREWVGWSSHWIGLVYFLSSFSFSLKLAFFAPGNGWFGRRDFPLKGALNGLFSGASSLAVSFRECITSKSQMVVYIYIYFLNFHPDPWGSGWWFRIFFIFIPIWGRFPIWRLHIFSKGLVVTTNQYRLGTTSFTHFFQYG